jgi:hypothetical protein
MAAVVRARSGAPDPALAAFGALERAWKRVKGAGTSLASIARSMRTTLRRASLLFLPLVACFAGTGCGSLRAPPPLGPQTILVRVSAGEGVPLEGITVRPSSGEGGVTDATGLARIAIAGAEGTKVDLSIACPEGYAAPASVTHVTVRRASRAPELAIPCKPYEHAVLIAFKTVGAANVPILYLGREIARTDDAGFALVELEPKVGETLEFTLDTSDPDQKWLRPQNPQRTVLVPDGEETFTIEQKFINDQPKAKRAPVRKPQVAVRLNPD